MNDLELHDNKAFQEVLVMITEARTKVAKAINNGLIDLYWSIGEYISNKADKDGWGSGTVENLSSYIKKTEPNSKGFSAQNLWRMKQFL